VDNFCLVVYLVITLCVFSVYVDTEASDCRILSMLRCQQAVLAGLCLLLGAALVSIGLLSHTAVPNIRSTQRCDGVAHTADQVVLVIVDALRPDFAFQELREFAQRGDSTCSSEYSDGQEHGTHLPSTYLTFASEMVQRDGGLGAILVADAPTTTSQRIKAIATGTIPAIVEAGSNFNSDEILYDSLVAQMNGRAVVLGDDTWTGLFPNPALWRQTYTYPSFNVSDLDSNDDNVAAHIEDVLRSEDPVTHPGTHARLIIVHFLGIDHAGHSFHAFHPRMNDRIAGINVVLRRIGQVLRQRTTPTMLVLLGDHGMTNSGDHGGSAAMETDTVLVAATYPRSRYTGAEGIWSTERTRQRRALDRLDRCVDILNKQHSNGHTQFAAAYQTDVVPTIALALGVPIPYGNIGRVLSNVVCLGVNCTSDQHDEMDRCNRRQVLRYADHRIDDAESRSLDELTEAARRLFGRNPRLVVAAVGVVVLVIGCWWLVWPSIVSHAEVAGLFVVSVVVGIMTRSTLVVALIVAVCVVYFVFRRKPFKLRNAVSLRRNSEPGAALGCLVLAGVVIRHASSFSNSFVVTEDRLVLGLLQLYLLASLVLARDRWVTVITALATLRMLQWACVRPRQHGTHLVETFTPAAQYLRLVPEVYLRLTSNFVLGLSLRWKGNSGRCNSGLLLLCWCVMSVAFEGTALHHFLSGLVFLAVFRGDSWAVHIVWWCSSLCHRDQYAARAALCIAPLLLHWYHTHPLLAAQPGLVRGFALHLFARNLFFLGGHQTLLSTVDWSSGFIGLPTYHLVLSAVLVTARTMASSILVIVITARTARLGKDVIRWVVLFESVQLVSSAVGMLVLYDHLMFLAIFAPKFAFDAVTAIVSLVVGALSSVA